jgi:hypothetical protein
MTAVLLLTATTAVSAAQDKLAHPAIDLKGKLYRAVFSAEPDTLSRGDIAELPDELRTRLSRFLIKRSAFKSRDATKGAGEAAAAAVKKRALERAIVALLDRDDAGALAVEFLAQAPIAGEWGPNADTPRQEAAYAERRLKPGDPLAPFLYVFIAQRQRAAFEAADRAKDAETMKAAAKKYRAVMQRARSTPDPIYALLADDLDRLPYVFLKTGQHPGLFNPDT